MSLHIPPEFVQKRIIRSVQNDKQELLKYLIFNHIPYDKAETLIKTKLLSLITNQQNCFETPLITGAVWLTDDANHQILMCHTKNGWDIPSHISNADADLEDVILSYLKRNFDISATSNGILDLDYIDGENIYEICFLMKCRFPVELPLKNSRLMTENDLRQISFNRPDTIKRRQKKLQNIFKEIK